MPWRSRRTKKRLAVKKKNKNIEETCPKKSLAVEQKEKKEATCPRKRLAAPREEETRREED